MLTPRGLRDRRTLRTQFLRLQPSPDDLPASDLGQFVGKGDRSRRANGARWAPLGCSQPPELPLLLNQ
jgi:hypothetical protein